MTVHALIPVFNRLPMTKVVIDCLRQQRLSEQLTLTVINDGSSDGTQEFLEAQADVHILQGDGNLWWGGAINLGLRYVLPRSADTDWVLLINNDTEFDDGFVESLLLAARQCSPAAVTATVISNRPPYEILSVGTRIDSWRLRVSEMLFEQPELRTKRSGVVEVDALSGRGVLYPVVALKTVLGKNSCVVPHYLADYELSLRVHRAGWSLYSVLSAQVISVDDFGSAYKVNNVSDYFFSIRSPYYLPSYFCFWWSASNWVQRITFPLRLLIRFIWKFTRVTA